MQGDSISAQFGPLWQNVVIQRTGMSLVMQDARSGRRFDQAFECWGNPPVGGVPGAFDPTYVFPANFGSCAGGTNTAFIGINPGMSFADSLANVDLMVIDLGTNDQSVQLGQLGDAVTANTFYGNMRWVVETYLNTKPTLRIVLVTTQYNRFATPAVNQQFAEATELFGNSIGIPVINMFKLGGVNAKTEPVLLRDSVHPSDFGFTHFYGPVIAQKLQSLF